MGFLNHPMVILTIGIWIGVFIGILTIGLLKKENRD